MHPEFPLSETIIHLNHAGLAPWPRRTVEAIRRFADENMTLGTYHYAAWQDTEDRLREQCRWLINAPSKADIALLKNTSEGLSVVAHGLGWQRGENVVTARQEFPSNRIVWESLQARYGVEARLADLTAGATPEDALLDQMDANTRLLAVSSVQYASGLRMDLERLGDECRRRGVLFCVDAIQSLGAIPFDVQACDADFVVADGHKWLLAPEGIALFYCKARHRQTLNLHQYGWHMLDRLGDYERMDWQPAATGRRFECGSPNSLGIYALAASLSLIQETGIPAISERLADNIGYLVDALKSLDLRIITPQNPARRAGILTFCQPGGDNRALFTQLQRAGVLCAQRGGGIRFSPHFYTDSDTLDRALDHLRAAIKTA